MAKIEVKKNPSKEELEKVGVDSWSPWSTGVSEFPWEYMTDETCYILEGKVEVTTEDGEKVVIEKGDLVYFPAGLKVTWKVLEPVRKVYTFKKALP